MTNASLYVLGVDYGTDSVRTILVDARSGAEKAAAVFYYPRWKKQLYCNPAENQFRQHPLDYIEGLEATIKTCLEQVPDAAAHVKAISVDTTGSSPVAVDKTGTPLALTPGFEENPNAMFVLWKDHTSIKEAQSLNEHATKYPTNYLKYVGGIYSSEWFWAKLLHILRADESIRSNLFSFVEHCDWIPYLLTGGTDVMQLKRGTCSAGHKALWSKEWGGLPQQSFFSDWDPLLDGITTRLFTDSYTADQSVGTLSKEWAQRLGLPETVVIGAGAFDAHMGAVGGQIEPYHLSKVMGTSTCDMLVAPIDAIGDTCVNGICGQVPGSVIPGMMGLEAGQSSFGDSYAWFKNLLSWSIRTVIPNSSKQEQEALWIDQIIPSLTKEAEKLDWNESSPLALDWFNGRRTPDTNQEVKAAISGLNLATDAPSIFYAIVEATCFGAKAIVERFNNEGVKVQGLIGLGGVARKSPFIMQMMADVINMPIRIHRSEQTCALGAAMFAATVAGIYDKVESAMAAMGQGFEFEYFPDPAKTALYQQRYQKYLELGKFEEES